MVNFMGVVRGVAAGTVAVFAANAGLQLAHDLVEIAKKVANIAADKLYIDAVLGCLPDDWSEKVKNGFEVMTQGAFTQSNVSLDLDLVKSTLLRVVFTFLLTALAYKVAHESILVNKCFECLSVGTRAVGSRIV